MKTKTCITLLLVFFAAQPMFALTGREIMDKSDVLKEPDTAKTKVTMHIKKGGRTMEKEFIAIAKKVNGNEQVLISFTKPTRIKLLTHTYKNRDDDQWLRLSSGRVKRIAAADKDKPFVNSHFYYEDLSSRNIDDYTYKKLGDEKVSGADCYKVEAVSKKGNKVYDKSIIYVRKSDYFVVKLDLYRDGKLHKVLENHKIKTINGIITPLHVVMKSAEGYGETQLKVEKVVYNTPVSNSQLAKESLR